MEKKILFVTYQSPVGTIWINETFRTAMGMYGEDIEPAVLLTDVAVVGYSATLNPKMVGILPCTLAQKQLKKFGTQLYAVKEDLERYHVDRLDEGYAVEIIERSSISDLFHEQDLVVFI